MTQLKLVRTIDELVLAAHKKWEWIDGVKTKYHSARAELAVTLLELRQRVEAGECGQVTWWEWYGDHFTRSRGDAEKLLAIASADEPLAAYIAAKASDAERSQKYRDQKKLPSDRQRGNSTTQSKPKFTVVSAPDPEPDEIREELIDQAMDIVKMLTLQERLRFFAKLRKFCKFG
jgi:hypothetical protein